MIAELNDIAQVWWQWMGSMFWQVSFFIIFITLLDMAIRRWAWPQVRYVLWGLVFIKLIIPPTWQMPTSIVSWIQPKVEEQISIQIAPVEVTAEYQETSISGLSSSTQITESAVKTEKPSWQAIVLLTWFAGMIAFSLILIIKLSRLPRRSKKRDDQNVPEWFQGLLSKTAQGLKLRKMPTVIFSNDAKSPAVYGIFKPVLLLPEGCLDHLSKEQTEHVLMHELCHLKRGDLWVHWFCLMLQVIYWFNPLLIWTRRQMRHVCEICCDLSVADILRERTRDYRETLLATARELLSETVEPGLGLLGVFEEPFRLVTRIRWLEKKTWENRGRKIMATIITSLIMVLFVMPMAGITQSADQDSVLRIQLESNPLESHETYRIDNTDSIPLNSISQSEGQRSLGSDLNTDSVESINQRIQEENGIAKQIYLDILIVEVDETKDLDLGLKWHEQPPESQKDGGGSIPDLPFEGETSNSVSPPAPLWGVLGDGITIGGKSFTDIKEAIEAMKTEPGINVISAPKIMTLDNFKASLKTGPIINALDNNNRNLEVSNQQQEWNNISLEVTPQIQENGYILQQIALEVSLPMEGDPNGISTKAVNSTVMVRDGATVVIGGISKNVDADENSSNEKELFMFLTSHIIETPEELENIFPKNEWRMRTSDGSNTSGDTVDQD